MSVVFGTIIGWLIADKIHFMAGVTAAVILSAMGAISLLLWRMGFGDLKIYFLLQYGGLVLALLMCLVLKGSYSNKGFLAAFGLYIFAKFLEAKDLSIYLSTGVSGHTLKHLVAALAIAILLSLQENPQSHSLQ